MLFPTLDFAVFFAISMGLVWTFQQHNTLKKLILLILSLFFYSMWNWQFLFLILFYGINAYLTGLCLRQYQSNRLKLLILSLGVSLNLAVLLVFKYLNFFIASLINLASLAQIAVHLNFYDLTLPVGISFLTFHAISYSVDVYRQKLQPTHSLLDVLLYISFFPHLVAGPIVRAHEFLPQLQRQSRLDRVPFTQSYLLILGGLFKKMVVANYLAVNFCDPIFTDPSQVARLDLILVLYAYGLQIFCDFSAYTDIAIGIAALLGYQFPQNFNQPYYATNLISFWRRWHITLSNWLRDYVYIPLGGNRFGTARMVCNLIITMLLGGLWHGAGITFVLWGGLHGIALALTHLWKSWGIFQKYHKSFLYQFLAWLITLHFICFTWILFRAADFTQVMQVFYGIWQDNGAPLIFSKAILFLLIAGILAHSVSDNLCKIAAAYLNHMRLWQQTIAISLLFCAILVMAPSSSAPFIYFQF